MTRRVLAILAAVSLCAGLHGCGNGNSDGEGETTDGGGAGGGGGGGGAIAVDQNPTPINLKAMWFIDDDQAMVGKQWNELDIFLFMTEWPDDIHVGKRHVVFYSRTCDHCEEMFRTDFDDEQKNPVHVYEIPADKETVTHADGWDMPAVHDSVSLEGHLPLGTDWVLTPPVIITLEDGIVTCAKEGDHAACYEN